MARDGRPDNVSRTSRGAVASSRRRFGAADPAVIPGWGNGGVPVFRNEFQTPADMANMNIRNNFTTFDQARAMASNVTTDGEQMMMGAQWYNPVQTGGPSDFNGGRLTHSTSYVDWRNNTTGLGGVPPVHFSQEYGMWVWKAGPTPSGNHTLGAMTALWLRNDGPQGEIDVMEAYGYEQALYPNSPMTTTWSTYIKETAIFTFHSDTNKLPTPHPGGPDTPYIKSFWRNWEYGIPKNTHSTQSLVHKFERMPTYMKYTVNNTELFTITPSSPDPTNKPGSVGNPGGTMAWAWDPDIYGGPMHVRMNIHVGTHPTSYGVADPANMPYTANIVFPVDYLRIYSAP